MNTINMPGFTAEVSLYKTSRPYRLEAGFANGTAKQAIIQQRIKEFDVRCDCDALSNICVCDDGSVFDIVLGGGNLP